MASNLYNKFADLQALEAEKDKILSIFNEIRSGVKSLSDLGINLDASKSKKDVDELMRQTERLKNLQGDYGKQLAVVKLQQQELNKANKEAAKDVLGLTNEYDKLKKAVTDAQNEAKKLQAQALIDPSKQQQADAASESAAKLAQQLNEINKKTGDFRGNVGRYAESLSDGFEAVRAEIAKLQKEQQGLQDFSKRNPVGFQLQGGAERLNQVNGALQQLNTTAQIGFQTNGNLTQQVRQLEKAYQNMAVSGNQSNEFLDQFKTFVAQAKDQLEDLRGEIKALSSHTCVFDQKASGVKFLAAGFRAGASAG